MPIPVTFNEFQQSLREAGESDDIIRQKWAALGPNQPPTEVVPGRAEVTGPMGAPRATPLDQPQQTGGLGSVRYKQLIKSREDAELDNFAKSELAKAPTPIFPPDQAAPAPPPSKPNPLTVGAKATGKMLLQGGQHFVNDLYNLRAPRSEGWGGESLLGALTIMMAIPQGIGEGLTAAIDRYVPNMEMTIAIPGSKQIGTPSPAGYLRAFLGAPSFALDPKMKQLLAEHPEQVEAELNRPMTYKELMTNVIALTTAPLSGRAMGAGMRALRDSVFKVPEPIVIQNATVNATPPPAPEAPPAPRPNMGFTTTETPDIPRSASGAVRLQDSSWPAYLEEAKRPRTYGFMRAEDVAGGLDKVADDLGHKTAATVEKPGAEPAKGVESSPGEQPTAGAPPSEPAAPTTPEAPTSPTIQLSDSLGKAVETLTKELSQAPEAATPEPRWTENLGGMPGEPLAYLDVPGTAVEKAPAAIVKEGESFIIRNGKGEDVGRFGSLDEAMRAGEQIVPEDVKGSMLQETKIPASQTGYLQAIADDVAAAMKHYLGDQAGKIDPATLAYMAAGAIIGGTQGTTPEERLAYALAGLVGAPFAKRLAGKLVGAIRSNPEAVGILDESNPVNPRFNPPTPEYGATTTALENVVDAPGLTKQRILTNEPPLQRSDIRAAQQISARAAQQVVGLAEKIVAGEPVEPGALKQAFALARDLYTSVRKIGKDVGINNLPPREAALAAKNHIDQLARNYDPNMSETNLAQAIMELPDVGLGSRLYYAAPDMILETMYTGQLLGTALVRNGVAMMGTMPLTAAARSMASLRFWDVNRPLLSSGPMMFVAAMEGFVEQLRLLKSWDKLGMQAAAMGSTKVENFPRGFSAGAEIASDYGFDGLSQGLEFLHTVAGVAPEVLARTDGMGKAVFGRIQTYVEAMEQAAKEGLTGREYGDRVNYLKTNWDELSPEARTRIVEFRDRITANKKFEGNFMQALQAGPQDPWVNLVYRVLLAPYIRTPVRLAELHADFTPGLNRLSTNYQLAMERGGVEASVAKGQLYAGVGAVTGFMALAMQGYITGACPADAREQKNQSDAGRPCMSFWDPLSQKYRSYQGLEPMSTLMAVGATLSELVTKIPEKSFTNLLLAAGLSEVESIPQKSYIQSISEMQDVIKNGSEDAMWEKSLEYIRRRLASFNPAALRELEKIGDPEQRRVLLTNAYDQDHTVGASLKREWWALVDQTTQGIPGVSTWMGAKKSRNMWTGDVLINSTWPFNPFTAKDYNPAPWAAEVNRLDGAGVQPIDQWLGGRPPSSNVGLTPVKPSPAIRMSADEQDRLEVLMTQVVKDGNGKLTDSLNYLVQSPLFRRQPDVIREQMIQARWAEFEQRAEARLLQENRPLRMRLEAAQKQADVLSSPLDSMKRNPTIQITPR